MELKYRNTVLFFTIVFVILLFLVLILNSMKKNNIVLENNSIKNNYSIYKVDDYVQLLDDSEWYVLKESNEKDKEVLLISKYKVNNDVIDDVNYYLKNTFKDELSKRLYISRNQISEVRLLNYFDICDLYNIPYESFSLNFDTSKFRLLENDSIVDYNLDNESFSLCREGFCKGSISDIRVVIKIAKFFIREEE